MSTASLKAQLGTSTVIRAVPLHSHGVTSLSLCSKDRSSLMP